METLKNGFHYPVTVILTSDEQFGYAREPIIQRMPDGSIVCLHRKNIPAPEMNNT